MIKEMKGWKVLGSDRRSCRARNWGFSLLFRQRLYWAIDYPVNVEVFPRSLNSKLFFFKYKIDAERFAATKEIIVPCIAKNVVKVKWISGSIDHIASFWKHRRKHKYKDYAPEGTLLAESIICLK